MVDVELCLACGGLPQFRSENRQAGHGESHTAWWLECSCGI